jgi:phosphoribosylformimino-5-aminoimidazole carboxamide ribotide isomerase
MAPFAIVPVLDLKGGQVVHARAGERSRYLPIRSTLTAGSEPRAVLDGLLSLAPFRRVYIADLDAIEGRGDHRALIAELARAYRGIAFWLDGGFAGATQAAAALADGAAPVLGSESLPDEHALTAAVQRLGAAYCVLSLDYRGERFVGPAAIEARAELWPDQVIAMTLSRVGSGAGPDMTRLAALRRIAGARQLFAAGGVRDAGDLDRLAAMGLAGALVASALHDGRLTAPDLAPFMADGG